MKMNKYILAFSSVALLSLTSCTNWLNQEPLSNVTTAVYFKNAEQFQNATNRLAGECYAFGRTFSSNESFNVFYDYGTDLSGMSSDEISGLNGAPDSENYYKISYQKLHTINDLLGQASQYTGEENIDKPVGQAYFYRAFWNFFLLKRYGGVTLSTRSLDTTSEEVFGTRNSRYEVVMSILNDLDQAIDLLNASGTTKQATSNNGEVTVEAATALKARVCLFEGTWEKYNGRGTADPTNGDGVQSGAGTTIPNGYPSETELLTMARDCAGKFVQGGVYASEYALWNPANTTGIEAYDNCASYYYFILEDASSNPYGLDKSSNDEAIFRSVFDFDNGAKSGQNLSHTKPVSASRKLIDMYLCTDGLPINISPLFQGYQELNSEFENRDARMTALFKQDGSYYWGFGGSGSGESADYTTTPEQGNGNVQFHPTLSSYSANNISYQGRKFVFERNRTTTNEAYDYNHIRLPEVLLIYAEATYELNGKISDNDLDNTINVIRQRAKIADLSNLLVTSYGLDMLEEIRRERAIELFGEGFRFSDLCRWGIAEVEINRPRCSYYVEVDGHSNELGQASYFNISQFTNYITTIEAAQSGYTAGMPTLKAGALVMELINNRVFAKKNYLQAIPKNEIGLNGNLLQNPGW